MIEGKRSEGKQWEKLLDGLTKWAGCRTSDGFTERDGGGGGGGRLRKVMID